jgi:CARDB
MSRVIFKFLASLSIAVVLIGTLPALADVVAERPVMTEPADRGQLPLFFSWTALTGGTLPVQPRGNRRVTAVLPAPSYELQISDRPDVGSSVLVEVQTTATSFFFTNSYPAAIFTDRASGPLSGGTYYCRVRGIFNATTFSEYSTIASFVFVSSTSSGGTGVHDYAITDILPVGTLVAGVRGTVLVRVRNVGTFDENTGSVSLSFDGVRAGVASIPALAPGESALLSYPVAPATAGIAALDARLSFADEGTKNNTLTKTVEVHAASGSTTLLRGRIRKDAAGFVLTDSQGRILAALTAAGVDLAPFAGRSVLLAGTLGTGNGRFVFVVKTVAPDARVK